MRASGVLGVSCWVMSAVRGAPGNVLVLGALAGGAICGVLAPVFLGVGVEWALSSRDWRWRLLLAAGLYALMWWLGQALRSLVLVQYGRLEQTTQSKLMVEAASRSLRADPRGRRRQDAATVGFAIDALAAALRDGLSSVYLSILPATVSLTAGLIAVWVIGGMWTVGVFLVTFGCYWFVSLPLIRRHEHRQRLFFADTMRSYSILVNSLELWREVRVHRANQFMVERYLRDRGRVERRALRSYRATRSLQLWQSGVLGAGLLVALWIEPLKATPSSIGWIMALVGVFLSAAAPLQDAGFSLSTLAVAQARWQEAETAIEPRGESVFGPGVVVPPASGRPLWCRGQSGAGKTTWVERLLGLRELADGSLAAREEEASYLPQEPSLLAATVRENVRFGRELADDAIDALLNRLGLEDFTCGEARADEVMAPDDSGLSVGEMRRVALARALVDDADGLVVLDEPTAGMDQENRAAVWQLIEEQAQRRTVIVATHDPDAPIIDGDVVIDVE